MTDRTRWALGILLVLALGAVGWFLSRDSAESELESAQAALTAWGMWAGDGDLSRLGEHFADGPQLAQLLSESIETGPPYAFTLSNASVTGPGFVLGTVTVTRPGESVQTFRWEIEMRMTDGRWKLWTVRTAA